MTAKKLIKLQIIKFFRTKFIKLILKKIFGSVLIGGPSGWVVRYLVAELFDEVALPIIKYAFRKTDYFIEYVEGKILVKKLESADNESEHNSAIDNIINQ